MRAHPLSLRPQRAKVRVLLRKLLTLIALDAQCCRSHADANGENGVCEPGARKSAIVQATLDSGYTCQIQGNEVEAYLLMSQGCATEDILRIAQV